MEAVEIFQQQHDSIDCVLCDLTMPGMNGWDTLTALRDIVPGIPIILSSGYSEAQVMAGHHSELPQAFLSKPYDIQKLNQVINRIWPQ
jgi:CheY-like chemotaxis protein